MTITTTEYINQLAFDYFKTYSFHRKGIYELLNTLNKKRLAGIALTKEEAETCSTLRKTIANSDTTGIFTESGTLNATAEKIAVITKEKASFSSLIEILRTEIEEEVLWVCAPVYRDAILFYSKNNELVNGIHICFECDRIESIHGEHIATDFKTFKYLKQLLLQLGHPIEDPGYFKADEILKTIEQNKNK